MESSSTVDAKQENNLQNEMHFKIEPRPNISINQQENQNVTLPEKPQDDESNQLDPNPQTNTNEFPLLNTQTKERNKKRKFTQEEDEKLRELVQTHGQKQWDVIARNIGSDRTARQCRDRWKHYLNPNVSQKEWTITEDRLLLTCTQKYGAQWAALVKFFPGRTDINLKNRWNKLQRKSRKLFQTNPNVQIPKLPANPEHIHFLNPGNMIMNQNQNLNANNQNEEFPQPLPNSTPMMIQSIPPSSQQVPTDSNKDEALGSNNNSNDSNANDNYISIMSNSNENNDQAITTPVAINVVNNGNSVAPNSTNQS